MQNHPRAAAAFLLFLSVVAVFWFASPSNARASNSPTIYWGASISGSRYGDGWVPADMSGVSVFESHAGKNVSLIHFGQSWQSSAGTWNNFNPTYFDNVRNHGSIPFFAWMSSGGGGASQPAFANSVIYNGTYDSYITQWATAAKNWGHPFFLRLDHEMNGWWYPWGEGQTSVGGPIVNGNAPGDFVKMWRHVHDIFTNVGATNVTWVWCPNHESTSSQYPAMSSLYPGDNYVDWICLDTYNRYSGSWLSFNQTLTGQGTTWMANAYSRITSVAPTKPMILGEFASFEDSTDATRKANWITDALLTQIPNSFPAIKGIIWYNSGSDSETLQIESTTNAQSAFAAGIDSSVYAANDFANLGASVIQPLSGTATVPTATLTPTLAEPTLTDTPTPLPVTDTPAVSLAPTSVATDTPTSLAAAATWTATETLADTETPLPPTATWTATETQPDTATPLPATATWTSSPVATDTDTPLPPVATDTDTPLPPTATPTATATPLPATATPTPTLQPSATPTFTPTPPPATATPTATVATIRLAPIADTYIDSGYPNTSFGASTSLYVNSSPTQKTFFKFDLTSLAGKTIKSATLQLSTTGSSQAGSSGKQNLHYVYDTLWSEAYMTFNHTVAPSSISTAVMGSLSNTVSNKTYQITLDVATVQKQTGSKLSMEADTSSTDNLIIYSRESSTVSYRPVLIISY